MEERIDNPTAANPTVQIDYFNAKTADRPPSIWQNGNIRAAMLAIATLAMWVAARVIGYEGTIMIVPIWCCGMWYVSERVLASRAKPPFRGAMAVCAMVAVGLSPFAFTGNDVSYLWERGWRSRYVTDLQRTSLALILAALIAFTALQISDVIRRRRTLRAPRAIDAQSLRVDS